MRGECESLAARLSERRSGELAPEAERALEAHLAGCPRCLAEARSLEATLEMLAPPEVTAAEIHALSARRIGKSPPRPPSRWGVRAVLVAAAAAALLTMATRPRLHNAPSRATPVARGQVGSGEDLFAEDVFLDDDPTLDGAQLDALTLEGPGIFGNLDQ